MHMNIYKKIEIYKHIDILLLNSSIIMSKVLVIKPNKQRVEIDENSLALKNLVEPGVHDLSKLSDKTFDLLTTCNVLLYCDLSVINELLSLMTHTAEPKLKIIYSSVLMYFQQMVEATYGKELTDFFTIENTNNLNLKKMFDNIICVDKDISHIFTEIKRRQDLDNLEVKWKSGTEDFVKKLCVLVKPKIINSYKFTDDELSTLNKYFCILEDKYIRGLNDEAPVFNLDDSSNNKYFTKYFDTQFQVKRNKSVKTNLLLDKSFILQRLCASDKIFKYLDENKLSTVYVTGSKLLSMAANSPFENCTNKEYMIYYFAEPLIFIHTGNIKERNNIIDKILAQHETEYSYSSNYTMYRKIEVNVKTGGKPFEVDDLKEHFCDKNDLEKDIVVINFKIDNTKNSIKEIFMEVVSDETYIQILVPGKETKLVAYKIFGETDIREYYSKQSCPHIYFNSGDIYVYPTVMNLLLNKNFSSEYTEKDNFELIVRGFIFNADSEEQQLYYTDRLSKKKYNLMN